MKVYLGRKGHYDSIHGRIRSDWKWGNKTFKWAVTVPPNTTAMVYMRKRRLTDRVREGLLMRMASVLFAQKMGAQCTNFCRVNIFLWRNIQVGP